jgi:hypothetical protein
MQVQVLKNSQINAVFGFLIVGFALPLYLLLLSGFPTADALKVCAMILVQIISGALIWAQVMHPRQVDNFCRHRSSNFSSDFAKRLWLVVACFDCSDHFSGLAIN